MEQPRRLPAGARVLLYNFVSITITFVVMLITVDMSITDTTTITSPLISIAATCIIITVIDVNIFHD